MYYFTALLWHPSMFFLSSPIVINPLVDRGGKPSLAKGNGTSVVAQGTRCGHTSNSADALFHFKSN